MKPTAPLTSQSPGVSEIVVKSICVPAVKPTGVVTLDALRLSRCRNAGFVNAVSILPTPLPTLARVPRVIPPR